jgi:hypothetical protein
MTLRALMRITEGLKVRRMKTRNQIEVMKSGLRKGCWNGKGQAGGRYEPNQHHSRLRAVRRIANDCVDYTYGTGQFSFGQEN